MKTQLLVVIALLALPAFAQHGAPADPPDSLQLEFDGIVAKFRAAPFPTQKIRIDYLLTAQDELNASSSAPQQTVWIPRRMGKFLADDEAEFAAVIAHETGHVYDKECLKESVLPGLGVSPSQIKTCETRADQFAVKLLFSAGYNPYAAAGMIGKLMMVGGAGGGSVDSVWYSISKDHPAGVDRIEAMKSELKAICREEPVCHN